MVKNVGDGFLKKKSNDFQAMKKEGIYILSQKIIDTPEYLMSLNEEELTEKLLLEKYNKANLRELVRRILKQTKEYEQAFNYQLKINEQLENKLESIKKMSQ